MRWIVSREFDLLWFFGGAALSLAFLGLYFAAGASIVALWWVWLLAFDGPHIGAAFTRTYADSNEWRTRRRLLLVSLLTFAIGPIAWLLNVVTRSEDPFLLYLAFATFYGYYHVVRQHYGFVALYNHVNHDYERMRLDQWALYIGCWAPYFYFLVTHPKARALLRLPVTTQTPPLASALLVVWIAMLAFYAVRNWRMSNPKVPYLICTVLLYGAIYFIVARYEPVYVQSTGPDQDFLLLSIVIVVFHNVQYLGLVWFHNRNRYGEELGHGFARAINRGPAPYLAACALFSAIVYFTFAWSTGVFPLIHLSSGANKLGLCLWWGLAMNHYYLDQKIWRVRGDDALRRALRL
jgi:hypothetical protein